MTPKLRIDAYVDLICPWCLIGKAQLGETAPEAAAGLPWHSVQLLPPWRYPR